MHRDNQVMVEVAKTYGSSLRFVLMVLEDGQEAKLSELGGMPVRFTDASRSTTINNAHRNVT